MNQRVTYLKSVIDKKTPDIAAFTELCQKEYLEFAAEGEIFRKSHFLSAFASRIPVVIDENELICGSGRFWHGKCGCYNMGHIIVDLRTVLKLGIPGVKDKIKMLTTAESKAFSEAVDAFELFIGRYAEEAERLYLSGGVDSMRRVAENCKALVTAPPTTFHSALQLVWFVQLFLHAEATAAAVSFGRFDEYMYPFLEHDLETGILTMDEARELLACFYIKTCEGDESQNLTVGGHICNPLSLMCLDVMTELKVKQPSLSVRISDSTPDEMWRSVASLVRCGTGQPSIFNDSCIIRSLENVGIPHEDAEKYAIVGCYEANPDGMTYGTTACGGQWHLHTVIHGFMDEVDRWKDCSDYESFREAFLGYMREVYNTSVLNRFRRNREIFKRDHVSPFESACFGACLENGIPAELGGCKYSMFGINILGIGTLIDSIYVIKKLVYEAGEIGLSDLFDQVKNNFPDKKFAARCRNLKGKYGSDSPETNELAAELSAFIADLVASGEIEKGTIPYAGLFVFLQDVYQRGCPATPDGRFTGERLSYGISASDTWTGKTVTSVMNSAAHIANDRFPDGNPLMFNIDSRDISGEGGDNVLRSLVTCYFEKGGFHVQFNAVGKEAMIGAKKNPEEYGDLIVRISGYSDYFNRISSDVQDALIERL